MQSAATAVAPPASNSAADQKPEPVFEPSVEPTITTSSDHAGDAGPTAPAPAPAPVPEPSEPIARPVDPAITKLINDCGGDSIVNAGPNETVFTAAMSALGFSVAQSGVTVHLGGSLSISSTPSQTKMAVKINVASISGLFSLFAGG